MRNVLKGKWLQRVMLSLTLILLSACEPFMFTTDSICSVPIIKPDAGFQDRWTKREKIQIEAYDELHDSRCLK